MEKEDDLILVNENVAIKVKPKHYLIASRYENKGETYWVTELTYMNLESLIRALPDYMVRQNEINTMQELHTAMMQVTEELATMCKELTVTHIGTGRGSVKIKRESK